MEGQHVGFVLRDIFKMLKMFICSRHDERKHLFAD